MLVAFLGARVLAGGVFALLGTDGGPVIRTPHWSALGGVVLATVGAFSLALFIALAVRSGGAAMGVWFLYFAAIENLLAEGLTRLSESFEPVVRFFPNRVFGSLTRYLQHDPGAFQRAVERAVENNRPAPEIWDPATLWLTGIAWVVVILGSSFMWFRRRDL